MDRGLVRGGALGMALGAILVSWALHAGCRDRDDEGIPLPEYGPPRPTLTAAIPPIGFLGDPVTVMGRNFDPVPSNNTISFNGGTCPAAGGDTEVLTCTIPPGASSGPLTVSIGGRESNPLDFTVLGGPRILAITPDTGPVGTLVTIDGMNFSSIADENTILFDYDGASGVQTPAVSATGSQLVCYAPAGADSGPVVVRVGPLETNAVLYTYTTVKLTDVVPRSGVVTDPVIIFGENFSPVPWENIVRFNGTLAWGLASTTSTILVEVPQDATGGLVTVERFGQVSNGIYFCVWTPAPTAPAVSGIAPDQGAFADLVTIQGSNFAANATDNEVRFNGILAPVLSATATSIDAFVPDGAATGPVTVRRGPEVATSPSDFTVTSPPPPPPMLDRLNPAAAAQGASIVLEGSGFHPVAANNVVTFAGEPAEVLAASPDALLVKVPFAESGVVTVMVGNRVSNGLGFTIQGAPPGRGTFPFFGRQISSPSDSVIYVLDYSLSVSDRTFGTYVNRFGQTVSGSLLDVMLDRITFSISELPSDFRFNIIIYDGHGPPAQPPPAPCADNRFWQAVPVQATLANKAAAIAWLGAQVTAWGTATTYAVEAALQSDPTNQTICLVTDGRWVRCVPTATDADQLCRMFNANVQNAEIHTVAILLPVVSFKNLLRDIAALTGGTFTDVEPPLGWPK